MRKLSKKEDLFLRENYPYFPKSMIFPIVIIVVMVVAGILIRIFGETDLTGWVVTYLAIGMLVLICSLAIIIQAISRRAVRDGVFSVDVDNRVIFRYGQDLRELRGRASSIVEYIGDGRRIHGLRDTFVDKFPALNGDPWGPVSFCTFRPYGTVTARVGGITRLVSGVAKGRWTECSVLVPEGEFDVKVNWRLVRHELSHVPLTKLGFREHHEMMKEMGVI